MALRPRSFHGSSTSLWSEGRVVGVSFENCALPRGRLFYHRIGGLEAIKNPLGVNEESKGAAFACRELSVEPIFNHAEVFLGGVIAVHLFHPDNPGFWCHHRSPFFFL